MSNADFSTAILGNVDKNAMTVYPFHLDEENDSQGHSVVGMTESVCCCYLIEQIEWIDVD